MHKNPGQPELGQPRTLAEMLCHHLPRARYPQLEQYRIEFERVHGPTDLTKRYTSTWPLEQQNCLIRSDPKGYFDGLPLFFKAYMRGKMEIQARQGNLDDMPDPLLRLFVENQMILDYELRRC
jgi:hypothetical protein